MASEGRQFRARIPGFRRPMPVELSGARVALRGVAGAAFNTKRQLINVRLFVPSPDEIRVLEPVPKDLFALPVRPIADVALFSPHTGDTLRVGLHGVVTLQISGEKLFIRDRTAAIEVETDDGGLVEPGREVDVVHGGRHGGELRRAGQGAGLADPR